MASLLDVAKLAKPALRGIDWTELSKRPPDKDGTSGDSVWHLQQLYYYDYIRPAGLKAMKVVDSLNIDIDANQAFSHFENIYSSVKTVKNIAWEAALEGLSIVGPSNEMTVTVETLRSSIAICWYTALFGAELHRTAAMQQAWRQFSDEDIVGHAARVTAMFECITVLDSWGFLKPLKKGAGTSGMGLAPLAAIIIGIGLVIAIAVVAFMVLAIIEVSTKNRELKKECTEAREAGDTEMYQRCLNALQSPQNSIATELFKKAAETATPWIAGGVAVALVVAFLPTIVRKVKHAGREART